jgi:hypothetical protein
MDPISKRRMYLTEVIPAGPKAGDQAEKVRTRLLHQVDQKRNPRTRATVAQLLDRWLQVLDVDPSTRWGYDGKIRKHIRPLLGSLPLTRLDVETLDSFYAELRRCRDHCDGRPQPQHWTRQPHSCGPACKPHVCKGLADSTVRQIHWILSGALDRAVVWQWIPVNPAEHADKPPLPHPDPRPPTAEEAARLVERSWSKDPDWVHWCGSP